MASMRDIKRRKTGIQSTQQITKAMKLVSTVKLQRAKTRAEQSKNYTMQMYDTIVSIMNKSGYIDHPLMKPNGCSKKAVILITSNRGLAGGYNSNITKLVTQSGWSADELVIYAIGKKGRDSVKRAGYEVVYENSEMIEEPIYSDASDLAKELLEKYAEGKKLVDVKFVTKHTHLLGDANGDGIVNVRDCAKIANALAFKTVDKLPCLICADYNQDGEVTVRDAAQLANFLAKKK